MRTSVEERGFWDDLLQVGPGRDPEGVLTHYWSPPPMLNDCDGGYAAAWAEGVRLSLAQVAPHISSGLRPGGVILDLGVGVGRIAVALAALCPTAEIIGVDISPVAVESGIGYRDAQHRLNVTFLLGDGRTIPDLGTRNVDAAYSMQLFQHLEPETIRGYLASLGPWMQPDGMLRVQWTVGPEIRAGAYAWNHPDEFICDAAVAAGFHPATNAPHPDPDYPTWLWRTFRYEERF